MNTTAVARQVPKNVAKLQQQLRDVRMAMMAIRPDTSFGRLSQDIDPAEVQRLIRTPSGRLTRQAKRAISASRQAAAGVKQLGYTGFGPTIQLHTNQLKRALNGEPNGSRLVQAVDNLKGDFDTVFMQTIPDVY